jgi:formylglycine-generating enzyme required for sulfatase activity
MEDIIKAILDLLKFDSVLELFGIDEKYHELIVGITCLIIVMVFGFLIKFILKKFYDRKNTKIAKYLNPFDEGKIEDARKYYIKTRFQNESPTREDEPGFANDFIAREELIPFFIKVFKNKGHSKNVYLILADSGMGKTTFMINLFIAYKSLKNSNRKNMILVPFSDNESINKLETDRTKVMNTILLLDAFDEYKKLIAPQIPDGLTDDERFRKNLDRICEKVKNYKAVVITCRSQYFPGHENKTYELNVKRFDGEGYHILQKFYISPFDDNDIKKYLNRRFGILKVWNTCKKTKARNVINNSSKLMARPMLLSNIDLFIDGEKSYNNAFQIYETLINKWIEREAKKRKKLSEQSDFKKSLKNYSILVAMEIYKHRGENGVLCLEKEKAINATHNNNINFNVDEFLKPHEKTNQSLLTPDAHGKWKFAHKSIYEWFMAIEASKNIEFLKSLKYEGMDMTMQFMMDLNYNFKFIKGGKFLMGSPEGEEGRKENEKQHEVVVSDFFIGMHTVTIAQFENFISETGYKTDADKSGGSYLWNGKKAVKKNGVNWKDNIEGKVENKKKKPVLHVSWNDAKEYCKWLSEKYCKNFRLPTEAEWEYACRANTDTPFNTGENLTTEQSNYNGNYPYKNYSKGIYRENTTEVGSFPANSFGLYDMHGNVWEWCEDWYDENYYKKCYEKGIVENPTGSENGDFRVLRGGGWRSYAVLCRSASRNGNDPDGRDDDIGFRVVFVP